MWVAVHNKFSKTAYGLTKSKTMFRSNNNYLHWTLFRWSINIECLLGLIICGVWGVDIPSGGIGVTHGSSFVNLLQLSIGGQSKLCCRIMGVHDRSTERQSDLHGGIGPVTAESGARQTGAKREQRNSCKCGWQPLANKGTKLDACCLTSSSDSWFNKLGKTILSYPTFSHSLKLDGMATHTVGCRTKLPTKVLFTCNKKLK